MHRAKQPPDPALRPAAAFTRRLGLLFLAVGLFAATLTVASADVELGYALGSIGAATAIMTASMIGFSTRRYLPLRTPLEEPPAELPVEPYSLGPKVLLMFPFVAVCVVAGYGLASAVDFSRSLVPALFLGIGLANLLATAWIGIWQRRHGRRVLFDDAGDDVRLYATG